MNPLHAVAAMISALLGRSAFIDALHTLVGHMADKRTLEIYDAATLAAQALLAQGASTQYVTTQLVAEHGFSADHAAVVAAAARATQPTPSAALPPG